MDKRFWLGVALIGLGVLSLALVTVMSLLGIDLLGFVLRLWPSSIIGLGLLLVALPFLLRRRRGLGGLFIPGLPILMTGSVLFLASVLNAWQIWAWLWPVELLSLAMGLVFAAVYMQVVWLAIPATILGINGLVFQFCAITGLWSWWSVLWVIEPLSVGLGLLLVGNLRNKSGLTMAGLILCGLAAAGLVLMVTVLDSWWPVRLLGPATIILAGFVFLAWGLIRNKRLPGVAAE